MLCSQHAASPGRVGARQREWVPCGTAMPVLPCWLEGRHSESSHSRQGRSEEFHHSLRSMGSMGSMGRERREPVLAVEPYLVDARLADPVRGRDRHAHLGQRSESHGCFPNSERFFPAVHSPPHRQWRRQDGTATKYAAVRRRRNCFEAQAARHQHPRVLWPTEDRQLLPLHVQRVPSCRAVAELNSRA